MAPPDPAQAKFSAAAQAFKRYFGELREVFLEREALFTQIELALLCREHVLVVGPPGTAKSAIASSTLGRILDERTGAPSLFSKQFSESTVQTDLIGPVDFKVLTETGRTEFLTDDGMLGAVHAFLDEVFDGRDMLLRSILNVLHERELKHGKKVTTGQCECAIMTSNRYLSEVLARSPELLLAFADRLSFICFTPKAFARRASRSAMLARAAKGQRPELRAALSLQQLDVLQATVEQVKVGSQVTEGLEMLSEQLERELQAQVVKLPDYVPTKYFSQRSVVKALWALKAAVVRDRIYRRPSRPLEVSPDDFESLRFFFLLGGPPPAETDALLKAAVDPRERAQLEIIRVEHKVFDEVLSKVRGEMGSGAEREAGLLGVADERSAAEALLRSFQAALATTASRSLREKLQPGPRHPENRVPLVSAAHTLVAAFEHRLARGIAGQGEGRGGVMLLGAFAELLELVRVVPELQERLVPLSRATVEFCRQALEMIALAAESTEFDAGLKLEGLTGLAANLEEELTRIGELCANLAVEVPGAAGLVEAHSGEIRVRVATSLRRRAGTAFQALRGKRGDPLESLSADSRRLTQLEAALCALSPGQSGLRRELLGPLGSSYAREALSGGSFERIEQFARLVQAVAENLRREGLSPEGPMQDARPIIDQRLKEHARSLTRCVVSPQP
ncbi:MAG: AAA family ATPase, partial [Myxococcaceae bacterium]